MNDIEQQDDGTFWFWIDVGNWMGNYIDPILQGDIDNFVKTLGIKPGVIRAYAGCAGNEEFESSDEDALIKLHDAIEDEGGWLNDDIAPNMFAIEMARHMAFEVDGYDDEQQRSVMINYAEVLKQYGLLMAGDYGWLNDEVNLTDDEATELFADIMGDKLSK
jgi:hypothetical protein